MFSAGTVTEYHSVIIYLPNLGRCAMALIFYLFNQKPGTLHW